MIEFRNSSCTEHDMYLTWTKLNTYFEEIYLCNSGFVPDKCKSSRPVEPYNQTYNVTGYIISLVTLYGQREKRNL